MIAASISEFRKEIKKYFNRVSEEFETLIIHRGKDKGVVVISIEEYNALQATQHELSSRANEARLDLALEQLKNKETVTMDLVE